LTFMKSILYLLLLGFIVWQVSCKPRQKVNENLNPSFDISELDTSSKEEFLPITIDETFSPKKKSDPYEITSANITGDTLFLALRYGGGCEDHFFTLTSANAYSESIPPQLVLYLMHDANKDWCRSMIFKTLTYDLRSIRYPGLNEILIVLPELDKPLIYSY
jgi:hypothetical protein